VIQPHEDAQAHLRSLAMLARQEAREPWRKHGNIPL